MPRPSNTRAHIIEVAVVLFAERSLPGVTMRDVARAAQVSLGTLHHHFGTKDTLYDECINATYEKLRLLLLDVGVQFSASTNPAQYVEEAARKLFFFSREHHQSVRLMVRAFNERGEIDEGRRERVHHPLLEFATTSLVGLTGRSASELRLPVQSLVLIATRYAISSDTEIMELCQTEDRERAWAQVVEHICELVRNLLLGPSSKGKHHI